MANVNATNNPNLENMMASKISMAMVVCSDQLQLLDERRRIVRVEVSESFLNCTWQATGRRGESKGMLLARWRLSILYTCLILYHRVSYASVLGRLSSQVRI
jgi:hypothetical protein